MLTRVRIALGIAFGAILVTSITAFAKGGFDFITIAGPDLKGSVRLTDTSLTEDFFTFANFYEDKSKALADPGRGYEITRHYVQGVSDVVFDRLHYYPETGFVFYDGIENGDSEYDGEWYTANPAIKTVFEAALAVQAGGAAPAEEKEPLPSASGLQPVKPIAQTKPASSNFSALAVTLIVLVTGLAALFAFAFQRRKLRLSR
jgi:hypothetical protein